MHLPMDRRGTSELCPRQNRNLTKVHIAAIFGPRLKRSQEVELAQSGQRLAVGEQICKTIHTKAIMHTHKFNFANRLLIIIRYNIFCARKQFTLFGETPLRSVAPRSVNFPPMFSFGHPASPRPLAALKLWLASQTKLLGG
jgi:hypothetical protein